MVAAGRHAAAYRQLGRSGLFVSAVGFGCYRVTDRVDEHRISMLQALSSGCNVLDTSTNYGDGASERLVGDVMEVVATEGRRDEVVVVSKVGYVQGANLELARRRESGGAPFPDMVRYLEGCWHCIHPAFIIDQLNRTLDRTRLERIDVYLLHNPEYYLLDAQRNGSELSLDARREVFYERLERAFECMEAQVQGGKIGCYGVSSNTLNAPVARPDGTSLTRMLEIAERVGGPSHHFAVIQCPLNLLEMGAAVIANNGAAGTQTVLNAADEHDVGVLTNRPLNAIRRGGLIRLADFNTRSALRVSRLQKNVEKLEKEFSAGLAVALEIDQSDPESALFQYSSKIKAKADELNDAIRWDDYLSHSFSPEVSQLVQHIDGILDGPMKAAWHLWLERYVAALSMLCDGLRVQCARSSQKRSDRIARALDPGLPEEVRHASLSSKAVAAVTGLPGVTCALVGMRQTAYVHDVCDVLDWPRFQIERPHLLKVATEVVA